MNSRSRGLAGSLLAFLALLVIAASPPARAVSPLCSSVGSNQNYEWVTRVAINGTSVTIPKTGYHDATATAVATLQAGQSYTVEVDVLTDGTSYQEYVKFWFDQNQNGAIEDPAELVFDQNADFATFRTFSGSISIPSSSYNGPMYVRMIMQYAASPALCGSYTYGTTVDLLVNVTGATANPTAPAAPTAVTAVAGNASATVGFTPSASSGVTGYTITSSPGGITATGAGSPITVGGLTNGTTYTFTVSAQKSATVFSDPSSPSNAVTPLSVVSGSCGAHGGATLTTTPTSLCSAGSASAVTSGTTDYAWSCSGSGGGSTASCSATRHYPVTTSVASGSGTVSASQNVAYNATPAFTVAPNAGSVIQSVTGCGGSLAGNTYTTAPVTAACSVSATFIAQVNGACGADQGTSRLAAPSALCSAGGASAVTTGNASYDWSCAGTNGGSTASCFATRLYTASASVASGTGTVSASQNVTYGATPSFAVTPGAGWVVQSVTGCGGSLSGTTYTTGAVTANCSVSATFVAIVNGACGSDHGASTLATPTAALCTTGTPSGVTTGSSAYDWSCAGANTGTTASCTAPRLYAVTASVVSGSGTISASQNVAYHATPAFTVTPSAGWVVQSVSGCGGSLAGSTYTTGAITANCVVAATFVAIVNGACGGDDGATLVSTPTQLCSAGSASAVAAGTTAFSWSCAGANTGTTASCGATRHYGVSTAVAGSGTLSAPVDGAYGATPTFTVTPQAGHLVQSVSGCGGQFAGTAIAGGTYTVAPLTASCTVSATFVANTPPIASAVAATGPNATPRFGDTLTGRYTYADSEGDPEDAGPSGTAFRWVRSADASLATAGDNAVVSQGATGGAARPHVVQTADVGQYLFYCVTPKAASGDLAGTESCSAATPLVERAAQAITLTPPATITLGQGGTVTVNGGPSAQPVTLVSLTPAVCTVSGTEVRAIAPGTCSVQATQPGDASYLPPAPAIITIAIDHLDAALVAVATPPVVNYRAPLVVTLDARGAYGAVTGKVDFLIDGVPIAGCAGIALDRGHATCSTNRIANGPRAVTTRYGGDTNYHAASSTPIAVFVKTTNPAARNRDTTGDGRTPIFFETASGGLAILTSNDNAPMDGQQLLPDGSGWHVAGFADFDGAGTSDLVLRHDDGRTQVWALDGIGVARVTELADLASDDAIEAIGDFDGDGKDDLLVKAADGSLAIWTMDGPAVKSRSALADPKAGLTFLAVADLDADGQADLVLATATDIRLQSIAGAAGGRFTDIAWPAEGWKVARGGDFDGDGRTDLVLEGPAGEAALWRLDGLSPPLRSALAIPAGWRVSDVVDFDGDFADDLVLEGPNHQVAIATLGRDYAISSLTAVPAGGDWRLVQVADFDGDGGLDLLFTSGAGELKSLRYRNGAFLGVVVLSHPTAWRVLP